MTDQERHDLASRILYQEIKRQPFRQMIAYESEEAYEREEFDVYDVNMEYDPTTDIATASDVNNPEKVYAQVKVAPERGRYGMINDLQEHFMESNDLIEAQPASQLDKYLFDAELTCQPMYFENTEGQSIKIVMEAPPAVSPEGASMGIYAFTREVLPRIVGDLDIDYSIPPREQFERIVSEYAKENNLKPIEGYVLVETRPVEGGIQMTAPSLPASVDGKHEYPTFHTFDEAEKALLSRLGRYDSEILWRDGFADTRNVDLRILKVPFLSHQMRESSPAALEAVLPDLTVASSKFYTHIEDIEKDLALLEESALTGDVTLQTDYPNGIVVGRYMPRESQVVAYEGEKEVMRKDADIDKSLIENFNDLANAINQKYRHSQGMIR